MSLFGIIFFKSIGTKYNKGQKKWKGRAYPILSGSVNAENVKKNVYTKWLAK